MPRKLDYYELEPESLDHLYRVQLPNSATDYDEETGFHAPGSLPNDSQYTNICSLRNTLTEYFNWHSLVSGLFISVFDDEDHAQHWAIAWSKAHDNEECTFYEIDPAEMEDMCIFEAVQLIDAQDLYVPEHVNIDVEYLVLEDIPVEAILGYWEVSSGDWDGDETNEDGKTMRTARTPMRVMRAVAVTMGTTTVIDNMSEEV